jgi:hypothetical protein
MLVDGRAHRGHDLGREIDAGHSADRPEPGGHASARLHPGTRLEERAPGLATLVRLDIDHELGTAEQHRVQPHRRVAEPPSTLDAESRAADAVERADHQIALDIGARFRRARPRRRAGRDRRSGIGGRDRFRESVVCRSHNCDRDEC